MLNIDNKTVIMGGRCVGHGGARAPPPVFFEDRQNISPCPPPQILVMIIKLIIGSNSGGSIKKYQHCTVYSDYSLYCMYTVSMTLLYTYIM